MQGIKGRIGLTLALLMVAALAGLYLSGVLVPMLLKVQAASPWYETWWSYARVLDQPQLQSHVGKIRFATVVGFALPLVVWLPFAVGLLRSRSSEFHGDARFASRGDLARAGLLKQTPEGVVIGKSGRDYLWLGGAQHVIMTAPTRSGKTTSVAIPVLLTYAHSVVCMDLKGELFKLTSGQRQAMGQTIHKFAPYAEDGRTHRFNPFMMMSADPRIRVSEIQTVGAILYPDDPNKDPFWTAQARSAFLAFASFMFENWDDMSRSGFPGLQNGTTAAASPLQPNADPHFPSFERIYRLSSGSGQAGIKQQIDTWLSGAQKREFMSVQTRTLLASLSGLAEETFSSVIATMQEPLLQFISPILAAATNACDFHVESLRRQPTSIYVVIPPDKLGESGRLLNIFFSTIVGQNLKTHPDDDASLKYQMLLLLDEFTAMGPVRVLSERISLTAGYKIRDLSIIQSLSQLDSTYGESAARTYITNHAASIVFTPREQRDATEYSEMLGYTTVRRRNRTISRGAGGGSVSYATTEERRALMLPQELKELPGDDQIVFYEGCPPIRCKKNWYFKDAYFKKRIINPVEIPPLALGNA